MRRTALIRLLFPSIFALVASSATAASPAAAAASPAAAAALVEAISTARLDPERAVEVGNLTLKIGMALFKVDRGTFFPATPVGDRIVEMVFEGQARLVLEPPDDIEGGQLELFTGSPNLEEEISEAVLAITVDAAVDSIYARPPSADVDPASRSRAEEIFDRWKERPERRLLGVETAILGDALGDPFYESYFAGWFRGEELGEFLYLFEPDAAEQITLGQFVTLDATAKEKRKLARQLDRAQRKGRLIGISVEDLGQWDTWLSASLTNKDGVPRPAVRAFEPQRYVLDLTLTDAKLELQGRARLELRAVSSVGRVVMLDIHPDLTIRTARAEDGRELYFHQSQGDVLVALPQAPPQDDVFAIELEYSGHLIDKVDSKTWALRSPTHWYPHAGTFDLATYDVAFHWPEKLDLVAGGQRVDGGVEDGGRHFERRRLDHPTFAFSFEVGKFRTLTGAAGHVTVTLALDPLAQSLVDKKDREELLAAVIDAVVYFEEIFGPYPLDELVVTTAPRDYSQSFLGFVTLSHLSISETNLLTLLLGLEDRRTVIAHEIAHQWWGHMVAWRSYRDQWISEAMANYAAVLYARNRLRKEGELLLIGPTTGWQNALTRTTADGRPIESLGPLVLGERLESSRSGDAYQAIVYKKGAVVLDMLSRYFREEDFLKMLRRLVEFVSFRPISTPVFVDLIERLSGQNLDGFAEQFIYGTGLPEIYYTYAFEEEGDKWWIKGVARQESPYRYRYRVVEGPDGALDVVRDRLDQIEVADSVLVVPVEIAVFNPNGDTRKHKGLDPRVAGNAMITTHLLLRGESSDIRIPLDYEPKELWLDRKREVFGRFFNEHRHPKRMLYFQGLDQSAAGRLDEAEALYRKALAAATFAGPAYAFSLDESDIKVRRRALDARIQLQLIRLYLDQDRPADAGAAFDALRKLLTNSIRYAIGGQVKTLEARLAIRAGEHERAYKLLRKALRRRGRSTERLLLLAIAARETGHDDEFQAAVETASERGADVSLLLAGP